MENETYKIIQILLIEDNPDDVGLIKEMLNDCAGNYTLITADHLSLGIKHLEEEIFDILLLDIGLPDSAGIEALWKVQDRKPELPIIILTGLADEQLASQTIRLGAQDYLIKGQIDGNLLLRSIRYAIERKRVEEDLRESEARLRGIASTALDAVILIDDAGLITFWNDASTRIFGYSKEEAIGSYLHSLVMPARHIDSYKKSFEAFRLTGEGPLIGKVYETEAKRKDGTELPVELSLAALQLHGKWTAVGFVREIAKRKQLENLLRQSYERTKVIIDSMKEGISLINVLDYRIVQVNDAFLKEYGYSEESEITGKKCYEITHHRSDACAPPDDICPLSETVKTGEHFAVEHMHYGKNGEKIYVEISTSPIKDDNGDVVQIVHVQKDITERKMMEERIKHLAYHDELTDLPNRRFLMDIMHLELAQAQRNGKKLAVMFLDLDRFKEVNDTLGHAAGDHLLKEAAGRLEACVRKSDTVSRSGGDEFNILLTDISHGEDINAVVTKIIDAFRTPFQIGSHKLHSSSSIGISIYPDDADNTEALFKCADIAMYQAKKNGRNTYQFYDREMNVRSIERMRTEGYLRRSIELGELLLHYQPQKNIRTGKIVCAEALVRWSHPGQGLLPPKRFIPVAEDAGFITSIDEWVLRTACAQFKTWNDEGYPMCIAVNLSAKEFQNPKLVPKIAKILDETGLSSGYLEIEVTESTAMHDIERTIKQLDELAAKGIRIAIDDFGTGYSSLSYLKRLPIQRLKIDRSFVKDLTTDPDDRAIISAVTAMAHSMEMTVIAEGVETNAQLNFLNETQCDEAQGFLFSRPLPAEEFIELIAGGK